MKRGLFISKRNQCRKASYKLDKLPLSKVGHNKTNEYSREMI